MSNTAEVVFSTFALTIISLLCVIRSILFITWNLTGFAVTAILFNLRMKMTCFPYINVFHYTSFQYDVNAMFKRVILLSKYILPMSS